MCDIDNLLKSVQIAFYSIGICVAILTYLSAKKGLLNTVNTEYQKRVMDRLRDLADELGREYDWDSPEHWSKEMIVEQVVRRLNDYFVKNRDSILKAGKWTGGIPMSRDYQRLLSMAQRIKSDPFIPQRIRAVVLDLLENRSRVIHESHMIVLKKYTAELAAGMHADHLDDVEGWLHNQIQDELRKRGCDVEAIEEEVHSVRKAIQSYFESFDPVKINRP